MSLSKSNRNVVNQRPAQVIGINDTTSPSNTLLELPEPSHVVNGIIGVPWPYAIPFALRSFFLYNVLYEPGREGIAVNIARQK